MPRARPRLAILVRDGTPISPLGIPAAASWLLGGPLGEQMKKLLQDEGLRVEGAASLDAVAPAEPAIVALDSVACSRAVLRGLLAAFQAGDRPAVQAALPEGLATRRLSHVRGLDPIVIDGAPAFAAPLYAVDAGARPEQAIPIKLPYKENRLTFPIPIGMIGRSETTFGASDAVLVRVSHWVHVLRMNLAFFLAGWIERSRTPLGRLWYLWRALLGFPWRGGRLAEAIRRVHRKAKIHHRAHVELSIVEEGATIGANAIVKSSFIARGARIDDGAIVTASVIGAGGMVASGATVFASVLCPGAFAAQHKMQFSLLGDESVAFTGSYFYDLNFERNVRVVSGGEVLDAGDRFLSVCLGPRARIAGGVWIASGREVPAGALVVQPPGGVLANVDGALAATRRVTIEAGRAVDAGPLPPPAEPAESSR
jgi:hypothetical protein